MKIATIMVMTRVESLSGTIPAIASSRGTLANTAGLIGGEVCRSQSRPAGIGVKTKTIASGVSV